ncbi:RNA polymerase sporulation sigma factor SigF [Thermanaerosceptrum fracticalcis]|uniref:RNA polymerase sigma factor n=1 Tax=Thermanaerosceptrum fracticalcis TaxID=1712410 RepID=A0A7G6E0G7_THEFR|nr:RNA polymerase sporulation sigma factor SigF [Thermanaerosceptrum fracticalcis]QNB45571.1 RNA polymerase sporulation sigma factor SigF [Thermanaerosceptrum fracticalcis]
MNVRLSEMNLPRFPLLNDDEMTDLLIRAQAGDHPAREKLINCNLRLVFNLVQRFTNRGYELEDLFQIGTIGLIKAIDKFNLSYNVKFSTYAVPMIIGEIRRFLRDDNPVKVSRSLKENAYKINKARDSLTKELGREPNLQEISEAIDLPVEEIISSLEAVQLPTSIHETLYQDDGDPIYVLDQLSNEKDDGNWFDRIALKEILEKLPDKEKEIILLRFYQDKTQTEVAALVGLSQVQVSRIERQALKKIRHLLQSDAFQTGS